MNGYPPAKVPRRPVLSANNFRGAKASEIPSVLDLPHIRLTHSGRYALALALQEIGISKGDEALLPAFHCRSMVEPVVWLGGDPAFYRIDAQVRPVLEDISLKITAKTKAILVPHYFGFMQPDLQQVKAICKSNNLLLIEDCAHAFFGTSGGRNIGSIGDYVIASPWKFFPTQDGGILASSHKTLSKTHLTSPNTKFEIKTLINTIENADRYRRLATLNFLLKLPLRLKDILWSAVKHSNPQTIEQTQATQTKTSISEFESEWLNMAMSKISQYIMSSASKGRTAELRRQRYETLLKEFSDLPACRPLFPELPSGAVPYLFPLIVDRPEVVFPSLKREGVPIERFGEFLWDNVDASVCEISADYSRRILQFPCHQELHEQEFQWLIETIKQTLSSSR
jgi:perosamine synthetase